MTQYNSELHMTLADIEQFSGVCPFDACSILSVNKIKEAGIVIIGKSKVRFFDMNIIKSMFKQRVFDIQLAKQFVQKPLQVEWNLYA